MLHARLTPGCISGGHDGVFLVSVLVLGDVGLCRYAYFLAELSRARAPPSISYIM